MSKTGKTAVVLAMAAGAVFLGIPLLDKCLGWFGCAFRPWVLSAAIVVPTVLLVAAVLTVMGRAIKGTVADKWEESSVVVKTIETFVLLIATGFLCLGIGGFGMILYGFSDTSEYVAERGGQKVVVVEDSSLGDTSVYYYAYKNAFLMGDKALFCEADAVETPDLSIEDAGTGENPSWME